MIFKILRILDLQTYKQTMSLLDKMKKRDNSTKAEWVLNKRIANGSVAGKKPDVTNEGVYKQYNDFKSKGMLKSCNWTDPTCSDAIIVHNPKRVYDAGDYIFRRGVNQNGLTGEYKFSSSTCIAANAGYYILNGNMCYVHSDGNGVLLNSSGATSCACGRIHQV
jgi:hypothetical protein